MMSILEFGDALLKTEDLDPVYCALTRSDLDRATLSRVCLAYWCFYNLGTAARIAEAKAPRTYWACMAEAAANVGEPKPWPRGAERRHFRGAQATQAVAELAARYPKGAEQALEGFFGGEPITYASVAAATQSHRGFGPWIAFKAADMSERVFGHQTDFSDCHLGIYKDPRQGAALALALLGQTVEESVDSRAWRRNICDDDLARVVHHYVKLWRKKGAKAPPHRDRLVNVQEIETIFCKYKSHVKGHYYVGKDIHEIREGLIPYAARRGNIAERLLEAMPGLPPRFE
jgi:hypothetical protein